MNKSELYLELDNRLNYIKAISADAYKNLLDSDYGDEETEYFEKSVLCKNALSETVDFFVMFMKADVELEKLRKNE